MDLDWCQISAASFRPNILGIALCLVFLANFLEAHGYGHFSLLSGGQTHQKSKQIKIDAGWSLVYEDPNNQPNTVYQLSTTPLCLNPGNSAMKPARFQLNQPFFSGRTFLRHPVSRCTTVLHQFLSSHTCLSNILAGKTSPMMPRKQNRSTVEYSKL